MKSSKYSVSLQKVGLAVQGLHSHWAVSYWSGLYRACPRSYPRSPSLYPFIIYVIARCGGCGVPPGASEKQK